MNMCLPILFLLYLLLQVSFWFDVALASRILDSGLKDAAFELDRNTFNSSLWAAPASWAMVEFYAHWCPACRNYKPQYERVARLFNGPDAIHPGVVYMAKVDCAIEINIQLCERFKVGHYPTLLWGQPSKFTWDRLVSDTQSEVEAVVSGRTAESLLQWINKRINKAYTLEDDVAAHDQVVNGISVDTSQVAVSVYDIEEATAKAMEIILLEKLLTLKRRSSFIQFLQLLVVHHPSKRCRIGTGEILMNLEDIWPSLPVPDGGNNSAVLSDSGPAVPDYGLLKHLHICGDRIPRGYWISCRGSRNDTRGYSCGLWLLFHALSVRIEDKLASVTFQAICNFVGDFFNCKECREHFTKMCSSVKANVASRHDLVLWLWRAHNEVNKRVQKAEITSGSGDPRFPKTVWPPNRLCAQCSASHVKQGETGINFHESEVYSFLLKFYGHNISAFLNDSVLLRVSDVRQLDETKGIVAEASPSSAAAVPIGAAIGIAIASCGFGAIACFWRMRQKKRKQIRRRV